MKAGREGGPWKATAAVVDVGRLFWWDAPRLVRLEAVVRLASVVLVQLFRGRASIRLSNERRRHLDSMLRDGGKDRGAILKGLSRYLITMLLLSPVNKLYWRLLRGLRQQWDQHLTSHFLETFLTAQCLACHRKSCEVEAVTPVNGAVPLSELADEQPDQRLAGDVGKFVQLCTALSLDMMEAVIHISMYGSLLAEISPTLSRCAVVAAVAGTLSSSWLGKSLPSLYSAERYADGEFVYSLTRARENAESIAFYSGQDQEADAMKAKLTRRLTTEWVRLGQRDLVQWFSSVYRQVLGLTPAYVLAGRLSGAAASSMSAGPDSRAAVAPHPLPRGHPPLTGGRGSPGQSAVKTDVGLVSQAREAFDEVLAHLLTLADNMSDLSRLAAVAVELQGFKQRAAEAMGENLQVGGDRLMVTRLHSPPNEPWLRLRGVTLRTPGPDGRLLLKDLTLDAPARGGLLIVGASGTGKTTLLRAIAGLWTAGIGAIERETDPRRVMFLPQRPYMQLGTLREQLLYPHLTSRGSHEVKDPGCPSDEELHDILRRVGLEHVLTRLQGDLSMVRRWTEELSLGEQQRVAVARILVHRPSFAILDEISAANDFANERLMYEAILSTCQAIVSVGHRVSLEAYHTERLTVYGEHHAGGFRLDRLSVAAGPS